MVNYSNTPPPPVAAFAEELRQLRISAGQPQIRTIASTVSCSTATVSEALNGRRLPSWRLAKGLVEALGGDWPIWEPRWRDAKTKLDGLTRNGSSERGQLPAFLAGESTAFLPVTEYVDHPAFYQAAAECIRTARTEIRVTFVRQYPPTQYGSPEAATYFDAILQWASDHARHSASARRIIAVPERESVATLPMFEWLKEHQREVRDLYAYEARVIPWNAACDWFNMALIDDSTTFLAFSGVGRQQLNGLSVEGAMFLRNFADGFDHAWGALEPIDSYLARHAA